ncbi:CAP domain-containing protein [Dactylosporangium sp. CA-139066]|uniref:CAP domain-containing protein n=1 Tax=Dactylosporangium sp. CA-139066 TaxID=3239930 RepID=UPI003D8F3C98
MRSLLRLKAVRLALVLAGIGVVGAAVTVAVASAHGSGPREGNDAAVGQAYLAGAGWGGGPGAPSPQPSAVSSPAGGASPSPSAAASPSRTRTNPAPTTAGAAPTRTTKPASTATAPAGVANAVLAHINELRASNGLPPYSLTSGLMASAHAHNLLMVNGCGLSHQCPGEGGLGPRISAQGVQWTALGENIGEGGGVANTTAAITASANGLTTSMYNETPPNDGHRKNLLSSTYTHVGIDVIRDSSGTVWLTQDFSN